MLHPVAWLAISGVMPLLAVDPQGGAKSCAGVPGSGLHPNIFKRPPVAQSSVHYAVERYSPGQTQVGRRPPRMQPPGQSQHGFLEHRLQRMRDVEMSLLERPTALAPRAE